MTLDEHTIPRTDGGRYNWNTLPAKRKADPAWARARQCLILLALCAGAWGLAWALWRIAKVIVGAMGAG